MDAISKRALHKRREQAGLVALSRPRKTARRSASPGRPELRDGSDKSWLASTLEMAQRFADATNGGAERGLKKTH